MSEVRDICIEVFHQMRENFIYTPDKEQFGVREHWTSHEDEVKDGLVWRDDCDGFAATAMALLAVLDIKSTLIFCKTETGGGHLVCGISDGPHQWIIDNRQRGVWDWVAIRYSWISALDSDGEWREIEQ